MEDIIGILLPEFVKLQVIEGIYNYSKGQDDVCILFCDICDFDIIIDQEGTNIVELLDRLFRVFDNLCTKHGVQKIETVGKTYMVASGITECEQFLQLKQKIEPQVRIIQYAQDMLNHVKQQTWGGSNRQLEVKIGINQGPVIAGIIGFHKPQFSLIGDTINTTSRICANCNPQEILISQYIMQKLQGKINNLILEEHKFEAKGKGILTTYYIKQQKQSKQIIQKQTIGIQQVDKKELIPGQPKITRRKTIFILKTRGNLLQKKQEQKQEQIQEQIQEQEQEQEQDQDIQEQIFHSQKAQNEKTSKHQIILDGHLQSINNIGKQLNNIVEDISIHNSSEKDVSIKLQQQKQQSQHLSQEILQRSTNKKKTSDLHLNQSQMNSPQADYNEPLNKDTTKNNDVRLKVNNLGEEIKKYKTFDEQLDEKDISDTNQLKLTKFWLQVNQKENTFIYEQLLQSNFNNKNNNKQLRSSLYIIIINSIISLIILIEILVDIYQWIFIGLNIFSIVILIYIQLKNQNSINFTKKIYLFTFTLFLISISGQLLFIFDSGIVQLSIQIYFIIGIFLIVQIQLISFKEAFCMAVGQLVIYFIFLGFNEKNLNIYDFFRVVFPIYISLQWKRDIIIEEVQQYNQFQQNQIIKNKQVQLLVYLLPAHILDAFLSDPLSKYELTDNENETTILFADIVGFTAYSQSVSPSTVVKMLTELFLEFDKKCLQHNVFKVYTIGDCYIVMGFCDANQRNPPQEAKNVIDMAFSMIEIIRKVRKQINFMGLDMRIGVHIGQFIGGVIGTNIVRYDIYGKDVLIANKMESNGEPGKIKISEDLKKILNQNYPKEFTYEKSQIVDLTKIKRKIQTYYIHKEDKKMEVEY